MQKKMMVKYVTIVIIGAHFKVIKLKIRKIKYESKKIIVYVCYCIS